MKVHGEPKYAVPGDEQYLPLARFDLDDHEFEDSYGKAKVESYQSTDQAIQAKRRSDSWRRKAENLDGLLQIVFAASIVWGFFFSDIKVLMLGVVAVLFVKNFVFGGDCHKLQVAYGTVKVQLQALLKYEDFRKAFWIREMCRRGKKITELMADRVEHLATIDEQAETIAQLNRVQKKQVEKIAQLESGATTAAETIVGLESGASTAAQTIARLESDLNAAAQTIAGLKFNATVAAQTNAEKIAEQAERIAQLNKTRETNALMTTEHLQSVDDKENQPPTVILKQLNPFQPSAFAAKEKEDRKALSAKCLAEAHQM